MEEALSMKSKLPGKELTTTPDTLSLNKVVDPNNRLTEMDLPNKSTPSEEVQPTLSLVTHSNSSSFLNPPVETEVTSYQSNVLTKDPSLPATNLRKCKLDLLLMTVVTSLYRGSAETPLESRWLSLTEVFKSLCAKASLSDLLAASLRRDLSINFVSKLENKLP